jgi:hypothetical protein
MVRRRARVAKEDKVAATRWQSCGSAEKPLQLRGHALPYPAAHDAYRCTVCAAARSEIREPNAGTGRITSFSSSAEASGRARRDRSAIDRTIDRQDRGGQSLLRLEWLRGTTSSRRLGAPRSRAARQSVARRRKHAARKFFPCARRVQRIPSPGAGREGIGLSSRSLIARRYRRTLAVEFAAHYIY